MELLKIECVNFVPPFHALFIFSVFDLSVCDGRIKKEVTICQQCSKKVIGRITTK
jgi:hypothetical protein